MKRKTGKFLSLLLSMALLCGLCVPLVSAAENRYSDTRGHWAEAAVERWSGYGVIQGYGDTFRPNAAVTRAQMAKILSNALGLTETSGNPFSDVAEDAWYAPYILRCYAVGIMVGDNGRANPDAAITRQQAMVMLGRALGIAPEGNPDLSAFVDGAQVGGWAAPYVAAMVKSGIVGGVGNGRLAPGGTMTRAALVTVLDRAVVQYIQSSGSYGLADEDGLVLIAAGDVTLSGETSANILVTPAADGRTVTFDKAVVTGDITVQADDAKITVKDSKLPDIALTGEGSKITENKPAAGSSGSGGSHGGGGGSSTPAYSSLTIAESKAVSSGTYQNVTITDAVGDGDVTLSGLTIRGNLYIYGGGSNSVRLDGCTILGKIIMAKASGQPPRLYLRQTPVPAVEVQTPAIVEAADTASAVTAVEAKADIEIKGEQTAVAAVTVPVTAEAPVAVTVTAGTVSKVEAKGEAVVSGAESAVDCVVAEATVTVDSAAVAKVEVPAGAENVAVNVQGTAAIEVEVNSGSTTVAAENTDHITVSGTAKDSVTTHTHIWNEGEVTKAATCVEEGVKTYTCTAADCPVGTKSEAIARTEHTPVTDAAVKADCLTDGKTEGTHCSVCGTVIQAQETVPALGHDFTGAYTSDGTGHWHTCTRCDAAGEKEAHTYNTATCDEAANCTVCGYEKAAGEHIWNEGEVTKAATCTEAGVKTYTCTVCKATKTEDIAATGHTEVIDPAVAPTCTETGLTEGKRCSVCNIVITAQETVAANGHTWDEGVVTTEPTGETEGVRTYTCTVCGGTKTETIPAAGADEKNGYDIAWTVESNKLRAAITVPEGEDDTVKLTIYLYNSSTGDFSYFSNCTPKYPVQLSVSAGEYDRVRLYTSISGTDYAGETPLADWALPKKIISSKGVDEFPYSNISVTVSETGNDTGDKYQVVFTGLDFNHYSYTLKNTTTKNSLFLPLNSFTDTSRWIGGEMELYALSVTETDTTITLTQTKPYTIGIYAPGTSEG